MAYIDDNLKATDVDLTAEDLREIDRLDEGLLSMSAVVMMTHSPQLSSGRSPSAADPAVVSSWR